MHISNPLNAFALVNRLNKHLEASDSLKEIVENFENDNYLVKTLILLKNAQKKSVNDMIVSTDVNSQIMGAIIMSQAMQNENFGPKEIVHIGNMLSNIGNCDKAVHWYNEAAAQMVGVPLTEQNSLNFHIIVSFLVKCDRIFDANRIRGYHLETLSEIAMGIVKVEMPLQLLMI